MDPEVAPGVLQFCLSGGSFLGLLPDKINQERNTLYRVLYQLPGTQWGLMCCFTPDASLRSQLERVGIHTLVTTELPRSRIYEDSWSSQIKQMDDRAHIS